MRSTLTLKPGLGRAQIQALALQLAREALRLESDIKYKILRSTPRGRIYRIGRITSAAKRYAGQGFRSYKTAKGNRRFIIGARIHRASAKGQPPAVRTGALLNANRAKQIGRLRWKISNSKKYGVILDNRSGLDRPFFETTVREFKPGYLRRMRAALAAAK